MATVLLDDKREKVKKAFTEYTKHCPHSDEVIHLRAEQWLEEVLNFVEASHDVVMSDYQNVGRKIKKFEEDCDACREKVGKDFEQSMKENDLFKHGDFYIKERMKVAWWVIGAVGVFLISLLVFIFTQQFNSLKTLTELSLKMDKRLSSIEFYIDRSTK